MARLQVAALALLTVLLATAGPRAAGGADAPAIRVGDAWTYETDTTFEEGFRLDGRATFTVDARRTVTVERTDHADALLIQAQGEGTIGGSVPLNGGRVPVSGTWDLVGEQVLESDGLKIVSSFLELAAQGVTQPFHQPFTLRVRNLTTFAILDDSWRFPVDVGDEGSVRSRANGTEEITFRYLSFENTTNTNGTEERTLLYRVEGRSDVDTIAGRFDAYEIRETWPDGRYDLLFFSPTVGNNVRTVSFNETGEEVATTTLVSYRYQALEPPTFLGLTAGGWTIALAVAAAGSAAAVWILHHRRARRGPPPPRP